MKAVVKLAVVAFLLWLCVSYWDVAGGLIGQVQTTLGAAEMTAIDRAVRQSEVIEERVPKDQDEFVEVIKSSFEEKVRNPEKDQWGTTFGYVCLGPGAYRLTSAGPDGAFGTDDDIVLERHGDRVTMNRDLMEEADRLVPRLKDEPEEAPSAPQRPGRTREGGWR